ncbi:MAG: HEAT repeat domain-containing protein [Planctomycetota bacterium]|nr:HEAT repeat domain-containing protein [Planctomycetota bacterium]
MCKGLSILIPVLAFLLRCCGCPAGDDCEIRFDEKGLSSIVHNGVELVKPDDPRFRMQAVLFLVDATTVKPGSLDGQRQVFAPKLLSQAFDAQKKILTQEYDGVHVECAYATKKDRLDMTITLKNNAGDPITSCVFYPLNICLPNTSPNARWWDHLGNASLGDVYRHEKGTVIIRSTTASLAWIYGIREGKNNSRPLYIGGAGVGQRGHHPIVDDAYFRTPDRFVAPGKSDTWSVSLTLGPPGATVASLCPEAYTEYAQANPMTLNWPDRRPIGTAFLCNPACGLKTNPRGWFQAAKDVDVTTEEGVKAFGERLMKYADSCIVQMKALDAQGIIIWDIEGQEMPHMISYIGDPRVLPRISPEMDRFADAFMKKFRDAGFKTGLTIRPTEVYQPQQKDKPAWYHREVKDPVAAMSDKIKYAQKRWGSTIFYMDSNVFNKDFLSKDEGEQMKSVPWTIPHTVIAKLQKLHPDCLIVPEWSYQLYYTCSAPYSSVNLGQLGTDEETRRIWPKAFRVVSIRMGALEANWEAYLGGVQKGDVLLFESWYGAQENEVVRLIYREAAYRNKGLLDSLGKNRLEALQKQASDPSEEVRFRAAAALGACEDPGALPALAAMLADESPIVRKRVLISLSQAPKIEEAAVLGKLAEWIKGGKDQLNNVLRAFAADALAKGGEAAVPALLDLLQQDKPGVWPGPWPYAIRALGKTGTTSPKAEEVLVGYLQASKPDKKAEHRPAVIEAAGLLRLKKAVPILIQQLEDRVRDNEPLRGNAVVALGRIGDPSAIEPLVKHWDVGYSTVVVYWISRALDEALASLTGQKEILGKDAWKSWWQKHHTEFRAKP